MSTYAEGIADFWYEGHTAAHPAEFTTAFRAGTGGHRVAVYDDRIVTHRRDGRMSVLPIGDIVSVSLFESLSSQPTFGAQFEVKAPPRDVAYRFDDAATRLAFLRAVGLHQ